ncbi:MULTISPECIES: hypothetical protein [unclassified Streptomyces]|jgi:hypothetical protein|uniref:hypothetical protein n=1 Tax=unclassified Streptomyces TaxID=2593676 RepID=UPI000F4E315E|nr:MULTISPECIES: hypothetical protein [unclassified Streptomyces]MDH6453375.1 hypothetical protein [Streptomyces sp. SAI-119]MDH6496069.1 hypothetical protein [Streptomyces sp. SAI-149]QUC57076.1 hypothetical protein IOD14_09895 [Streptomyces sp. A2-16]GLP63421.1 hypothetical protein TUSST3_00430 [Streptomyces sp. TUS-ST3]
MARWVVVVQSGAEGGSDYSCEEVVRFEDTLEQARARLYEIACTQRPRAGLRQKHREVFRIGEGDAYYVRIQGRMSTFAVTYHLAEQVWSSDPEPKNPWR